MKPRPSHAERRSRDHVRDWLEANVEPGPEFGSFDEEFEWVAGAGPPGRRPLGRNPLACAEFGGRGASPVEVAIFNVEYAAPGRPSGQI